MSKKNIVEEKPKDFKDSIKKLVIYSKPFMKLIILALILSMTASILSIIGPDKVKDITNIITEGLMTSIDLKRIEKIGIILVIFFSVGFVCEYLQGFIMAIVTNKFSKKMRTEISNKINASPLSYFDSTTVEDVLS